MGAPRNLVVAGLATSLLCLASCYPFYMPFLPGDHAGGGPSPEALLQLADAYAASRLPSTLSPDAQRSAEVDQKADENDYNQQLADDLRQHNYDALEKEAKQ